MTELTLSEKRAQAAAVRAEKLSPDRKAEIAKVAATSRWGYKATHKGNFMEDFGIDVECYVLNDSNKTAVISQRGMGLVLGLGDGGSRLPTFLGRKNLEKYIGHDLKEKIENPLIFQYVGIGQKNPLMSKINGFDATILIDLCKVVIAASANGVVINLNVLKQANIIVSASAKLGIRELAYKLSGYVSSREEVIAAFKLYVHDEAKKYEKEFPSELYLEWSRLYGLETPVRGKSWKNKHLTIDHVYYPLAKSDGNLLKLLKDAKSSDGGNKKLFQFLNEVGTKALRMHLGRLLEMAESSSDKIIYENKVALRFGGQPEFNFYPT